MMTMTTQGKTLWAVVLLALSVQEATGFGVNHLQSSRSRRTTIGNNDNTNTNANANPNTNTGDAYNRYRSQKTVTTHLDTMAAGGNFFDDFRSEKRQDDSSSSNNNGMNNGMNEEHHNHHNGLRREASAEATNNSNNGNNSNDNDNKFVTGDDLHRLRHQVLAMRLELRDARSRNDAGRVRDLEKAITRTQQVDAEFVYTVSLERSQLALRNGDALAARRYSRAAEIARSSLPQFQLEGLWVGKYGEDQGYEMINVTYAGDTLVAHKVTSGTKHVPRGAETFRVDLSPQQRQQLAVESKSTSTLNRRRARTGGSTTNNNNNNDGQQQQQPSEHQPELSPIELGESAARQWGCKYLQRFAGKGQVASEGYRDSQWMEGQLILVNEYFSFAWVPIGHQVFFGRPTPELVLKLMRDETKRDASELSPARSFLEKCWEETEHIEDDMEADRGGSYSLWTGAVGTSTGTSTSSSNSYYDQEGCFE